MKRKLFACTLAIELLMAALPVFADQTPTIAVRKEPAALVRKIRDSSVAELQKLTFVELNLLKNGVYAAKGYKFAEDRQWLNLMFCHENEAEAEAEQQSTVSVNSSLLPKSMLKQADDSKVWNLGLYEFPVCKEGEAIDEDQMKAVANIRVAMFKKIEALKSNDKVDEVLKRENVDLQASLKRSVVMGRQSFTYEDGDYNNDGPGLITIDTYSQQWYESILRETHGYNRMLQLMKKEDNFDAMELLGLYVGDIRFLRDVIEARYGKPFQGVLGWEISQLIGIREIRADYDPKQLPLPVQVKLQLLDDIMQKIINSDLNDIPESLKGKSIDLIKTYDTGAC
jgi:hypothetical protein